MKVNLKLWIRKMHRWGAIVIAFPLLIVVFSGILLQIKNEFKWVQPPTRQGRQKIPSISFEKVLAIMITVPEAEVSSWRDIDRLDVRPNRGIIKVRCKNHWEIQLDSHTGEILQTAIRRSDIIEAFHVGSWFHPKAKLWLFLPSAFILFGLWLTGIYLFFLKIINRQLRLKHRYKYKKVQ